MEEEIDLRVYAEILLRYWKWIVGLAVGAAAVALIISLLLPPVYEASAVILVTQPRYQLQFDPRLGTEQITPAYKAFPTLATSDAILQAAVDGYEPSNEAMGGGEWNLETMRGMAEATSGGDPSLVELKVTSQFPRMAAELANVWADLLVETGNRIYGQSQEDVAFFQQQLQQAQETLDAAEAALVEFEARNESSIVSAQLDSLNQAQADYLASQRTVAYIIQDIQALHAQLAQQSGSQPASLEDSLTALLLQIKAFNVQASTSESAPITPIQLQIESGVALSEKTQQEQGAFFDRLAGTLETKSGEIDERLAELEPQILSLQRKRQEINVESDQLSRARDLARETHVTLARKLDEARIAAQEEKGILQVGSYAAVPGSPVGPPKKLITALAGMLGLVVGIVGAFAFDFWRRRGT